MSVCVSVQVCRSVYMSVCVCMLVSCGLLCVLLVGMWANVCVYVEGRGKRR